MKPRQACAVESAASVTGLSVVVLLASDHVDLEDEATCNLARRVDNVYFRRLAPEIVLEGRRLKDCVNI